MRAYEIKRKTNETDIALSINLDGTGVDLYIGHAAYKAADYPENEIAIQIEFARYRTQT